jgi:iron complex outermembrane recepter protein
MAICTSKRRTYQADTPEGATWCRNGTRSQYSAQFPIEFVDRIDIIKGASSFLCGFAPPGGGVDYALKGPEDHRFVTATASYRSDSDLLGRVDVNQPITSKLGVRVNALYEGGETYLQDDEQRRRNRT